MANDESTSRLHIDSDWKAEAQAEKERLSQKEQEAAAKTSQDRGLPQANFQALVGVLTSQAIMGLGAYTDPKTNRVVIDLEGAKFSIDLLEVVEQKTKGNLSEEEATEIKQVLAELRNRFVQITQLVAKQKAAGNVDEEASPSPGIVEP
jgi:hypothetical protein